MARLLDWHATVLQQQLDLEGALATMEVVSGEDPHQPDDAAKNGRQADDPPVDLKLGPYTVSPLRGLHFDTSDDTAAS